MTPRHPLVLVLLALVVLAASGCGESEEDKFDDDYKTLNDGDLLRLGRKLDRAVSTARGKTNAQVASEFDGLAGDGEKLTDELTELKPPDDLKDELNELTRGLDDIVESLEDIASGARTNDVQAVRTATVELVTSSREVNAAQNKLAAETGAKKGSS